MITFQTVRTARFSFTLQELNLGAIRNLYDIPVAFLEKQRSTFLKYALKELQWHKGYEQNTLEDLTLQERLFIEACYLASTGDVADFPLANGHYSDFLQVEKQFKHKSIELGSIPNDDDVWHIQPLTGLMLESLEERVLGREKTERVDWILYAMAAQLFRKNEELPDPKGDFNAYGDWLDERVGKLSNLPETALIALIGLFFSGQEELAHFFSVNFDKHGVYVTSQNSIIMEGEEVAVLPARFRPSAKFSAVTQKLLGKFEEDYA